MVVCTISLYWSDCLSLVVHDKNLIEICKIIFRCSAGVSELVFLHYVRVGSVEEHVWLWFMPRTCAGISATDTVFGHWYLVFHTLLNPTDNNKLSCSVDLKCKILMQCTLLPGQSCLSLYRIYVNVILHCKVTRILNIFQSFIKFYFLINPKMLC